MARVITPECILSYPNVFTPRAQTEGETPKFSVACVFPEGTDLTGLKKAAMDALKERWGDKTAAMLKKGQLRTPFRTDGEEKGYPEGSTFINARSTRKPGIVSIYADANGKPLPITDESKVYPGVIAKVSLDPYTYDKSGNRGVTFGLGNIQIIRDGDRLDGRVNAADEFDADLEAVADLSDLDGVDEEPEAEAEEDDLSDLIG